MQMNPLELDSLLALIKLPSLAISLAGSLIPSRVAFGFLASSFAVL